MAECSRSTNNLMRFLALICAGLLGLTAYLQVQILQRLDQISHQAASTSVPAMVTEFRKQMAQEEPPAFSFEFRNSGGSSKFVGMTLVGFRMTRRAGPASDISIKVTPGISVQLKSDKETPAPAGRDFYYVEFERQDGALPASWTFSVSYNDFNGNRAERVFEATYNPKSPVYFQVVECVNKQPDTALEATVSSP